MCVCVCMCVCVRASDVQVVCVMCMTCVCVCMHVCMTSLWRVCVYDMSVACVCVHAFMSVCVCLLTQCTIIMMIQNIVHLFSVNSYLTASANKQCCHVLLVASPFHSERLLQRGQHGEAGVPDLDLGDSLWQPRHLPQWAGHHDGDHRRPALHQGQRA